MYGAAFWKASAERAVKTFAQSLLAVFGADAVFDVVHADWQNALSIAAGASVLSLLSSVASSGIGGAGPSLANEVTSPPAAPISDSQAGAVNWLVCIFVAVLGVCAILLFGWTNELNIGGK